MKEVKEVTNGELIKACIGQCCAVCDYHSECETFKSIYGRLPEEFRVEKEGVTITAKVTVEVPITLDKGWMDIDIRVGHLSSLLRK